MRFGYGTTVNANGIDDYPTRTGENNKGNALKKFGQVTDIQNNSNPDGKAFFFRDGNIYFLTTMVGYRIRMKTPADGSALLKLTAIKDVQG